MIAFACSAPNRDTTYHATEQEAMTEAAWLTGSNTATKAVHYRVVIEPPIRLGYWERVREAA